MSEEVAATPGRSWAIACHLSALVAFIGIPFGNLLGPMVVWFMKRTEYPVVEEQGKEALNFQLSVTIYSLVAGLLVLVVIGIPLLIALVIFDVVMVIVAAIKVNNGEPFQYPLTFRLIK